MIKLLETLFKWVVPPGIHATDEEHYVWRIGMVIALGAALLSIAGNIAFSMGMTPLSDGFATNEQVASFVKEVRTHRADDLTIDILNLRVKQCEAKGDLRAILTQQLTKLLIDYKAEKGQEFPLPGCESE